MREPERRGAVSERLGGVVTVVVLVLRFTKDRADLVAKDNCRRGKSGPDKGLGGARGL